MTCEQLESHTEPSDRTIDDYDHDNGSSSPYLLGSYDKPIIYSIETLKELRNSPLCVCPSSLVIPNISMYVTFCFFSDNICHLLSNTLFSPKQKRHAVNSTSFNRVDGFLNQQNCDYISPQFSRSHSLNKFERFPASKGLADHNTPQPYTRYSRPRHEPIGSSTTYFENSTTASNDKESNVTHGYFRCNRDKTRPLNENLSYPDNEFLSKFELLGRERCGNVIASYKPVNDKLRVETCWDLSGDNINKRATDSDSNIQEFKEWKNDMRRGTTELNVEQIDDDKRPLSDWAKLNQMMTTFNVDNGLNNDFNNENLFRGSTSGYSNTNSKFSGFFNTEPEQNATISPGSKNCLELSDPVLSSSLEEKNDSNDFSSILAMLSNFNTQNSDQKLQKPSKISTYEIQASNGKENATFNDKNIFMNSVNKNEVSDDGSKQDQNLSNGNRDGSDSKVFQDSEANNTAASINSDNNMSLPLSQYPPEPMYEVKLPSPQNRLQTQANHQLFKSPLDARPQMMGHIPPAMIPFPPPAMVNVPPGNPSGIIPNMVPLSYGMGHISHPIMMAIPPGMPQFPPGAPIPMELIQNMDEINDQLRPYGGPIPLPGFPMRAFHGSPVIVTPQKTDASGFRPPNTSNPAHSPGFVHGVKIRHESK